MSERVLLSLALVVFFLLCLYGMWLGWRRRARRQAAVLPAFPQPPATLAETEPIAETTGVYVGSTIAGDWQDRVAVGDVGFRAEAVLRRYPAGLLVDRTGATALWIPAESLVDARTDRALAGKVMAADGLLVVRWRLGDHLLDTGFRGDDKDVYEQWVAALRSLVAAEEDAPSEGVPGGAGR
ncbi:transporter [Solihabitans fulvus]|uniref:Transporter n=1 Tax=Solihabitans fulvus TaxID=1892852 RepID=A0A5B2XNM4_9PSEU|nr:transporter [Solihabitans fulvus]KAA2265337.1 transporter [Solihabitans fulvus]